jgi:xylulokinase
MLSGARFDKRRGRDRIGAVIAGIDLGTQGVKVLLLDRGLRTVGRAFEGYPTRHPRPGWAEQDPADWEQALGRAARRAAREAGVDAAVVEAVGVTGQLDGCVPVGSDGRSLHPCLIWMDRRAAVRLPPGISERLRAEGGVNPDPGHLAAKARWLSELAPELAAAACFHQPVSYLVDRLTGERVWDHGLASISMLYSLGRRDYEPAFLEAFALDRSRLPRIAAAEQAAGALSGEGARLTGLRRGIPVAVGTGDDYASPLGAGMVEPGGVACISGTAEVVGGLAREPLLDPEGLVETHCYPGGLYFVENPGWLSGGAVAWLAGACGLADPQSAARLAAGVPAGAEGALFLPALSGAMAPEWVPEARGCFYGLTASHGTAHLARAVLEGCAFAMRDVVERLAALGVPAGHILLMGGAAREPLWARIRADVSGLPVFPVAEVDTAPVGAALLAAVAAGLRPDLASCAAALPVARERVEPDPRNASACNRGYRAYRRLFECLRPMFTSAEEDQA